MKRMSIIAIIFCLNTLNFSFGQDSGKSSLQAKQELSLTLPYIGFHVTGNDIKPRFGKTWYSLLDKLYENNSDFSCLLLSIATEPKTKEEIIAQCKLSAQWVGNALDSLVAHSCMGITNDQRYYSNVPIFTGETMRQMLIDLKPISESVAKSINRWLPQIKKEYSAAKLPSDPEWEDIAHFVLDKLILDGQFHTGLVIFEKEKGFMRYYSEDQKKIPAWFKEYYTQYGTYGCNWYTFKSKNGNPWDLYYMHGSPLMRFSFPLNNYKNSREFSDALHKIGLDGSLDRLSSHETQLFEELGWTRDNRLVVPIVNANSLKDLFENTLQEVGIEAANIVFDMYEVILESYKNSPYSDFSEGAGDYIQVCYHLLFTGIANELIRLGATPPIPQPTPKHYGVYITDGSLFN